MSWSVSGIGRPEALASKLADDLALIPPMQEPEESGKKAAVLAIVNIVPAFPPNTIVKVEANGSQYTPDSAKAPNIKINSLTISIQSLGSIVE